MFGHKSYGSAAFAALVALGVAYECFPSGGIVFGGSADVAFTTAPVGAGGIAFGGSASVAFTRSHPAVIDVIGQSHLNEASWNGTPGEVIDSSGRGHHGVAEGGVSTIADGKLGRCGNFDGVNDAVNIPISSDSNFQTFSISVWVKPNTLSSAWRRGIIVQENYLTSGYRFGFANGGQPRFWTGQSGGSLDLSSSQNLALNEWNHLVVTYCAQQAYIYLNGVLRGSATGSFIAGANIAGVGGIVQEGFSGSIDEVAFFCRALTQEEVTFLYNSGSGTEDLPSQYTFGGIVFGGSADVAFVHVEPTQGGMYFGGAADVAFTKAVVGSGGIVFGGRAYIGDVIGSKFWLNGPGFELGDLLRAQQVDFDKDHNPIQVYSIDAEVVEIRSGQKMVLEIKAGKEYLTSALKGQLEFVRLGNRLNSARQGSVMVTSQPAGMMVMDGVDDFSKWGTLATYKGVFGKLDWINDPDFGQLSGWGAFIPNLYAKGNIILGPYSSIQWANVAGGGKPANNATVGADWGSNVTGRPTNLVAIGDVPGYIKSTYIDSTEIKAPNITGNSILGGNIVASSGGTNTAGLTGEGSGDSNVRIWAGDTYANRASAPFRVTQGGTLTATNIAMLGAQGYPVGLLYVNEVLAIGNIQIGYGSGLKLIGLESNYVMIRPTEGIGTVYVPWNAGTLWGSGNDGSGSGLDADLWDGKHMPANAVGNLHNDGNGNLSWV